MAFDKLITGVIDAVLSDSNMGGREVILLSHIISLCVTWKTGVICPCEASGNYFAGYLHITRQGYLKMRDKLVAGGYIVTEKVNGRKTRLSLTDKTIGLIQTELPKKKDDLPETSVNHSLQSNALSVNHSSQSLCTTVYTNRVSNRDTPNREAAAACRGGAPSAKNNSSAAPEVTVIAGGKRYREYTGDDGKRHREEITDD